MTLSNEANAQQNAGRYNLARQCVNQKFQSLALQHRVSNLLRKGV